MAKRDYYDVLGVGRSADEKDLKAAYRKLAKQLHPDANQGDAQTEAKFKELNEAYDVLKDPQKRAAYDRFGHQAFENGMGGGRGGGHHLAGLVVEGQTALCEDGRGAGEIGRPAWLAQPPECRRRRRLPLAAAAGPRLTELDLNPIMLTADGAVAVDWLIVTA